MDNSEVIDALSALAQTTRLDTFRLLVTREPEGIAAGELARLIAVPQNTMSTHLSILARAGLVRGERQSRSIIYRADLGSVGIHREFITAAARWIMAAKLWSVFSARSAMRLNSLSLPKKFSIR